MNYPLGVFQYYNKDSNTTHFQWSYVDDSLLTYFEIEVYDEKLRTWVKQIVVTGLLKSNQLMGVSINYKRAGSKFLTLLY
ncbi:hypothetical protein ACQKM9_04680 [Viridibacillus sp. NPDC093762]|uniref:hypothetical protein n=1 Tax=Viridibacillus sp. NPDC093762 TaxID=3390720 RepID=UPI003D02486A